MSETTLTYPLLREMSLARAPLFSHFGAAIQGLTSIRAYGAQEAFKLGASTLPQANFGIEHPGYQSHYEESTDTRGLLVHIGILIGKRPTIGSYTTATEAAFRWIGLRIDLLGGFFSATLAA